MSRSTQKGEDFLDNAGGATTLSARVVDVYEERARIHGFDLDDDLAPALGPTGALLTTWLGELPNDAQVQIFGTALTIAAPFAAHEGPVHAALVARACGSDETAVLSTAYVVLAQRCGGDVDAHAPVIAWLTNDDDGDAPACAHDDTCDRAALDQVRGLPPSPTVDRLMRVSLCRTGWALALAVHAGLREKGHLEAFLAMARLPALVAEAVAAPRGDLAQIPLNLPSYRYEP